MKQRTLGRTGWLVGEIGLGTMGMGGGFGPVDDDQSVRTLLHAFERGVNFVDTALAYGEGRAHAVVARALREWSGGKVYVATKVWPMRWPSPWEDDPPMRGRYPAWYLAHEVEKCLKQLSLERLDLLQLHCWLDRGVEELDWLESLNGLRLAGKVDRIGVSIRDNRPEEGVRLAQLGLVDTQQVVFNLFDQRPAQQLFRASAVQDTGFIARVPFDSGALIGGWTPDTYAGWDEQTHSFHKSYFKGQRFAETYERVRSLERLCAPHYPTLAEAAMRFCLSDPAVSVVIPGMMRPEEVDLNVAYSDGRPFPDDLRQALRAHAWARNFYFPDPEPEVELGASAFED
ncbi:MAG: aldo/keto reductase [Planctomycetota bacterium]